MTSTALALALALLALTPADGAPPAEAPPEVTALAALPDDARRARMADMSRDELAAFMQQTPGDTLVAMGLQAVARLGTYTYTLKKQERVGGKLLEEQHIATTLREKPFAARLDFVAGPSRGRRLIFNPEVRADAFRVREAGFFSIAGRVWVRLDSSLAKRDSNHSVKESGLGNLLRHFSSDLARAREAGGITVKYEGWDADGMYCALYVMPNGGKGFPMASTRICTDVAAALPARVEGFDAAGQMLERFVFTDVRKAKAGDDVFDPDTL